MGKTFSAGKGFQFSSNQKKGERDYLNSDVVYRLETSECRIPVHCKPEQIWFDPKASDQVVNTEILNVSVFAQIKGKLIQGFVLLLHILRMSPVYP